MSVPPDQMQPQPTPPGGAGGAGAGDAPPGPAAAPTATPQQPKGEQASADAGVQVALRMLERALVAHGSGSAKGKVIQKAIASITKEFGDKEEQSTDIMPAEVKTALMAPSGPPGGGPQSLAGGAPGAAVAA
jgi:hypothetical protein